MNGGFEGGPSGWFEYDWQVEGIPALFSVDLDLKALSENSPYTTLFYVSCADKEGERLSRMQLFRLSQLHKKLIKLFPVYAGSIETAEQHQLYFYGDDPGALETLNALIADVKGLECRAGMQADAGWRTYCSMLYPDDAKLQTEQNRIKLKLHEERGDCVSVPRKLSLGVYFPSETLLISCTEQARQAGFALGKQEFAPETDRPHGITLQCVSAIDKRRIDRLTTRVIRLVSKYDGRLSYWSCGVVRKRKR